MDKQNESIIIGAHVSISGGVCNAIDRAAGLGCNTFQIFTSSPQMWRMKAFADGEADRFREKLKTSDIASFFVHAPYLPNIASPEPPKWEQSLQALIETYRRAAVLGADGLVTHTGSHRGAGVDGGLERGAKAISEVIASSSDLTSPPMLLMEIAAGKSNQVGVSIGELNRVWELIEDDAKEHIGICFDTCHAHAMGYDLSPGGGGFERALEELESGIGKEALKLIHLNDSKPAAGDKVDRHANLGEGTIGMEGITAFVNNPFIVERNIPLILETPIGPDGWQEEIELVKKIRNNYRK